MVSVDTTASTAQERTQLFINGVLQKSLLTTGFVTQNLQTYVNGLTKHGIGVDYGNGTDPSNYSRNQFTDIFFVDGQALTPDVFGFNKPGKGYISAGSALSTDFRPGQWVPKKPRVIIADINRRGGFGVNGFYLPMNDSNNFGADFHCTPNSILKLQENLPQPRCRVDGVGDYTGALRDDPFKQYLLFAQPNVLGGLQSGYGDYSHVIRGSGTPKTITGGSSGTPTISTSQSLYYGSSLYFDGNDTINVETSDSNYLGRDFTIEFWVWHDSAYPISQMIFNTVPHVCFGISLNRDGSGQTALYIGNGSVWQTADFRSGGRLYSQQWNHVVVERYNNAITIYHNGVAQSTTTAYMPTGFSSSFRYGTYNNTNGEPVVGYIQDYRVYSGVAKYKGGFDVPKPYTPVGIATWRAVPDTPANNFCTLNPLSSSTDSGLTNGNLDYNGPSAWRVKRGTIQIPTTGKWYFEARLKGTGASNTYGGAYSAVGVCTDLAPVDGNSGIATSSNLMLTDTGIVKNFTAAALSFSDNTVNTGSALSSGDIISLQIDRDANTYNFLKNGVSINSGTMNIAQNTPLNVMYVSYSSQYGQMTMNFGQNPTFSGNTTAGTYTDSNGKGLFKYQPPSGFLALCEDNLPTPSVPDPGKHFKTINWTGNDANSRAIVGVGFKPDLVWIKNWSNPYSNHLYDSVRGPNKVLYSDLINQEFTDTDALLSFDSDGFSIGYEQPINRNGDNMVAWCWKAGQGATSINTSGSITSTVSVNQTAGFSIVSYTGAGTNTVGHGLGKAPAFMIIKARNEGTASWVVYHKSIGATQWLPLNSTAAVATSSLVWNNTEPTSSVFTLGSGWPTYNYINYCWAEIEGYSKFTSYVGNGSTDGPFVYCGFKPAMVIVRMAATTLLGNWQILDSTRNSTNPATRILYPNTTSIEYQEATLDFLSNGFKIRSTSGGVNTSGETFIVIAFAESPFQMANAK
jgi:hypothetical protein